MARRPYGPRFGALASRPTAHRARAAALARRCDGRRRKRSQRSASISAAHGRAAPGRGIPVHRAMAPARRRQHRHGNSRPPTGAARPPVHLTATAPSRWLTALDASERSSIRIAAWSQGDSPALPVRQATRCTGTGCWRRTPASPAAVRRSMGCGHIVAARFSNGWRNRPRLPPHLAGVATDEVQAVFVAIHATTVMLPLGSPDRREEAFAVVGRRTAAGGRRPAPRPSSSTRGTAGCLSSGMASPTSSILNSTLVERFTSTPRARAPWLGPAGRSVRTGWCAFVMMVECFGAAHELSWRVGQVLPRSTGPRWAHLDPCLAVQLVSGGHRQPRRLPGCAAAPRRGETAVRPRRPGQRGAATAPFGKCSGIWAAWRGSASQMTSAAAPVTADLGRMRVAGRPARGCREVGRPTLRLSSTCGRRCDAPPLAVTGPPQHSTPPARILDLPRARRDAAGSPTGCRFPAPDCR